MRSIRWLAVTLLTAAALCVLSATAAAATHVYASGALGAGGQWTNPPGAVPMNFNRMSVLDLWYVEVEFLGGGLDITWDYDGFVQDGVGGASRRARCANRNTFTFPANKDPYCAWYD